MTFRDFIKDYGELKLAQKLNVSLDTVKSWRYGNRIPRPKPVSYTHLTLPTTTIV